MSETSASILYGCKAIAGFLGLTPRQALYRVESGEIPTFRIGRTVCARPAALNAWMAKHEAKGRGND